MVGEAMVYGFTFTLLFILWLYVTARFIARLREGRDVTP